MTSRFTVGVVAVVSGLACGVAGAEEIALFGGVAGNAEIEATLLGGGHTFVNNPNLNDPITADTLYFGRGSVPFGGSELLAVQNFLNGGGRVMTEFSDAAAWFDGRLGSFSGTLVDGFFVPSGDVCGGNNITVVDPTMDLSVGLGGGWGPSGDPIGVYQVYQNLDPMIHTPIMQLGTAYGDIAVAGCAPVGLGTGVIMFTDFGDFYDCGFGVTAEDRQLLLNAVVTNCRIPTPGAAALLGLGALGAVRRRRA
jgi:hypothetical protein